MYLLDTNICIYYMNGKFGLDIKLKTVNPEGIFISEITLAELKYGVHKSGQKEKNQRALDNFLTGVTIIPIFHSLDFYAEEKARLRSKGIGVDDFDLLIGCTSVVHNLVMVTNNTSHFRRILKITLEDWTTHSASS